MSEEVVGEVGEQKKVKQTRKYTPTEKRINAFKKATEARAQNLVKNKYQPYMQEHGEEAFRVKYPKAVLKYEKHGKIHLPV